VQQDVDEGSQQGGRDGQGEELALQQVGEVQPYGLLVEAVPAVQYASPGQKNCPCNLYVEGLPAETFDPAVLSKVQAYVPLFEAMPAVKIASPGLNSRPL